MGTRAGPSGLWNLGQMVPVPAEHREAGPLSSDSPALWLGDAQGRGGDDLAPHTVLVAPVCNGAGSHGGGARLQGGLQ